MIERYKLYYRLFLTIFWIETCFGFVAEELLPFIEPLRNVLFLLCDVATLILGLLTMRKKGDILIFVSFFVLGIISTVILNRESWMTLINGSRDFFGMILAVPIIRWFFVHRRSDDFKRSMMKQLNIWLWLQAVCITEQFIRYGANDHGGGTMGEGASGIVSMSIYAVSFFLLSQNWDSKNVWGSIVRNKWYLILLYPTFLNETKISFIILAAYLLLLIPVNRRMVLKLVYIIPLAIISFIGIGAFYLNVTKQDADELLSEEFYNNYFFGTDIDRLVDIAIKIQYGDIEIDPSDVWSVDIPRISKLILITPEIRDCKGGLAFGAGVGQFKGGQLVQETKFMNYNRWLLQGSRPWLFFVFVQLGILGLIWMFSTLAYDLIGKKRGWPMEIKIKLLICVILGVVMFYNDSLRNFNFCVLLFFILLSLRYFNRPAAEHDDALGVSYAQSYR